VRHNPTGEEWDVGRTYGSYVDSIGCTRRALAADCILMWRDETCTCATAQQRNACTKQCDAVVL